MMPCNFFPPFVVALIVPLVSPASSQVGAQSTGKKATGQEDLAKLQGAWFHVSRHEGGKEVAGEDKDTLWVMRGNTFVYKQRDRVWSVGTIKLVDSSSNPKKVDLIITDGANEGMIILAIFEVDGDVFRYCGCAETRPSSFETSKDDKSYTYCSTWKRQKR